MPVPRPRSLAWVRILARRFTAARELNLCSRSAVIQSSSRVAASPLQQRGSNSNVGAHTPCSRVAAAPLAATWEQQQRGGQQQHGGGSTVHGIFLIAPAHSARDARDARISHFAPPPQPHPPSPRPHSASKKSSPRNYTPLHPFTFTPPRTPKNH